MILQPQIHDSYKRYFISLDQKQHVNESTHRKGHILDYIVARESEPFLIKNTTIGDFVSDHRLILCDISIKLPNTFDRVLHYRKIKDINIEAFKKDILDSELLETYMDLSTDQLLDKYNNILSSILDKHAPLVTRRIKNKPKDPWVNDELLDELRQVRRLERKWRKSKLETDKTVYDLRKESFYRSFSSAKSQFLEEFVIEHNANQGELFKAINRIMHRKKTNPMPEHESPLVLANQFCDFFQEKVAKIRENFSDNSTDALLHDTPEAGCRFASFEELSDDDIVKIISQSTNKYCELDPIPSSLLKQCSIEIMPVIKRIINKSLSDGYFPDSCKKAIVKPLLKKPNLDCVLKNYRPVSNLSYIGKLIEKSVCNQISKYMNDNKIGEPLQSAYKANHSTETAILWIFDQLLTNLNDNNAVLLTLLDLSAAFDTVDHEILLKRLQITQGISDDALRLFTSYLKDRTMQVCVNGEYSKPITLDVSLPQGSQLGPRLYSDYTQPIGQLIRFLHLLFHGYADDTQLLKAISSVAELNPALQQLATSIGQIGKWMHDNKLKLNPEKTEFMVIASKRNIGKYQVESLTLGNEEIKTSSTARNLGVTIDSTRQLDTHIANILRICYFYLSWIRNIRKFISTEVTKTLVHALVLSRLDYCNSILVGLPKVKINKLQKVMNAAARLITGKAKRDHVTESLKDLHWLPVKERSEYKVNTLTYKALHGMAPSYLSDLLKIYVPERSLRSSDKLLLQIPRHRNNYGYRSYRCTAPSLWNDLPYDIRCKSSFICFKKALKTHLFRRAYHL